MSARGTGPPRKIGRKSKAEEMGLKALLDKCWTPAQREACIKALAGKASDGDMEAVKLLMAYTFGKPKETKEVKNPEGESLRIEVHYVDRPIGPASSS